MSWYAIQIDHIASAEFSGRASRSRRSIRECLEEDAAVVWVPFALGDKLLFPGYIFARPTGMTKSVGAWAAIPGVIKVLEPSIPEQEIAAALALQYEARSLAFDVAGFEVGDEIELQRGPLKGLTGILIHSPRRKRKCWHLAIRINGSQHAVEVDAVCARRLAKAANARRIVPEDPLT